MKFFFFSLSISLFTLVSSAQSGICLTPTGTLATGQGPRSMVTAFFNNDAFLDLAVANHGFGGNDVLVYMGNGNGTFNTPTSYTMGSSPRLTKADFNNDGFPDIATANEGSVSSPELSIRLNNGNGTFGSVVNYTAGTSPGLNMPQYLASKDFNNDGRADVALINMNGLGLSVFLGTPSGTLGPCTNYSLSSYGVYIISDKFNNDNFDDLVISNGGGNVFVLFGTASGTFAPATTYSFSSAMPFFITSGDFNNDTYKDIATIGGLLLGSSSGTFAPGGNYNISGGWGLAAADFDQDGFLDLAINTSTNSIIFLRGLGNGNFGTQTTVPSIAYATDLITGDFNGDGKLDLVAGNGLGSAIQLFRNNSFLFNASASPTAACSAFVSTLSAFSSVGNYTWSLGGNANTTTVNVSTNTIIGVSSTNSVGCVATKTLALVITTPTLLLTASNNSVCPGFSSTLNVNGATSYSWSTGTIGASIIVSPSANTLYIATGTNTMGCSSTGTIFIGVNSNPTLVITASSLSLCGSGTINLSASGANSYTWNTGSNASAPTFSLASNTCYTVSGTNLSGCKSSNTICATVLSLPSLSVSGTNTVCSGTSANLMVSGANSYTWSNGAMSTTINVLPSSGTQYSVVGVGINGCSTTAVHFVSVNVNCSDVWPGDANSDGIVNSFDILELGLAFGSTGSTRTPGGNSYVSQFASNWTGTVSSGKNKCHSDCNGDGIVNASDTLAVYLNFSLGHSFRPIENKTNYELTLVPEFPNFFIPGEWNSVSIMVSDATNPLTLFGLVFDVNYASSSVQSDSVYLKYSNSFFNSDTKNIEFKKSVFADQKIYAADVKTAGSAVSGYGEIAKFFFKAKSNLTNGSSFILNLSQPSLMRANGSLEPLSVNALTLTANPNALGFKRADQEAALLMSPNPCSNSFVLRGQIGNSFTYALYDLSGNLILNGDFMSQTTVNTSVLEAGVYILQYKGIKASGHLKVIVQH